MAVDQQNGVGPDGQVNPGAVQQEPQSNLPDTPDLSTAQKQQDAVNAGAAPEKPVQGSEKEISAATPVAQAAANGKPTEEEEKDAPILETLLGMSL
jgi:hypothetical protein